MRMNLQNIPGVWEACCSEERKVIKFLDRELFLGGKYLWQPMWWTLKRAYKQIISGVYELPPEVYLFTERPGSSGSRGFWRPLKDNIEPQPTLKSVDPKSHYSKNMFLIQFFFGRKSLFWPISIKWTPHDIHRSVQCPKVNVLFRWWPPFNSTSSHSRANKYLSLTFKVQFLLPNRGGGSPRVVKNQTPFLW